MHRHVVSDECHQGALLRLSHRPHRTIPASQAPSAPACPRSQFEVFGKVQGVFFRKYTQAEARRLDLRGWCMNTRAGTVTGEAAGGEQELAQFAQWLQHKGSPKSKIKSVTINESGTPASGLPGPFTVRK